MAKLILNCAYNALSATPHIGFVAEDLYRTFYGDAAAAIAAWIEKQAPST